MTDKEQVARWMISRGYATGHGDTIEDLLAELEWQAAEREREACAQVCEDHFSSDGDWCAKQIRKRGEK